MRNPADAPSHPLTVAHEDEAELVYASDVQIMAESGGLQLTFLRPRPVDETARSAHENDVTTEVIARVVLPPLAARRLLRLLPGRLDMQQELADEYARQTDDELAYDPFLAALAEAELDDEPYTEEQRAAAQAGREAVARGEFATLADVWRELVEEEDDASTMATS